MSDEIERAAAAIVKAWNAHDADTFCRFYAVDADYVAANGTVVHGRDALRAHHRRRFATVFAGSALVLNVAKVRTIARNAAALLGIWSIRGQENVHGSRLPVQTGVLLAVLRNQRGIWKIAALQVTAVSEPIPGPESAARQTACTTLPEDRQPPHSPL